MQQFLLWPYPAFMILRASHGMQRWISRRSFTLPMSISSFEPSRPLMILMAASSGVHFPDPLPLSSAYPQAAKRPA